MNITKEDLAKLDTLLPTIGIDEKSANMGGSVLENAVLEVAQTIIDKLKESIIEKKVNATENLLQSIIVDFPKSTATTVTVAIEMASYYQWVEDGRGKTKKKTAGSPTVKESIEEWITAKGIHVKPEDGKTILEARESMALLIARKIHSTGTIKRFGYKGSGFIADVLTQQNIDVIAKKLSDLTGLRLQAFVTTEIAK